jgi:tRNA pseudouridine55 synthase
VGEAIGSAAHLGTLRRTESGRLALEDAVTLDDIAEAGPAASRFFHDPVLALGLPTIDIRDEAVALVRDGRPLKHDATGLTLGPPAVDTPAAEPKPRLVALRSGGRLLALYEALGDNLVPQVVFPDGIETGAR